MKRPVAKISNLSRRLATFASDVIDHSRSSPTFASRCFASSLNAPLIKIFAWVAAWLEEHWSLRSLPLLFIIEQFCVTLVFLLATKIKCSVLFLTLKKCGPRHNWVNLLCDIYTVTRRQDIFDNFCRTCASRPRPKIWKCILKDFISVFLLLILIVHNGRFDSSYIW